MKSPFFNALITWLTIFVCFSAMIPGFAQRVKFYGTVKDEISQAPVAGVNITVNGTSFGVVSDPDGHFSLSLEKIPASVTISCIGYETVYYDILKQSRKAVELIMRPKVYNLREVEIPATRFRYVFRDNDYSVLDYEIVDDRLLLLIFRYQLKRSELILLTLAGDTVNIATLPEMKPKCLYKDFLEHVHYVSTAGKAYQYYYDDTLHQSGFIYQTTFDSLRVMAEPYLFTSAGRVYFQEFSPDGFGKRIGYFNKERKKEYIRFFSGESTRNSYYDDQRFNSRWNSFMEAINPNNPGSVGGSDAMASKLFFYKRINAPLVKLGESDMAIFNFSESVIELMDQSGKVYKKVPITFHKEGEDNLLASLMGSIIPVPEWKWHGKILTDEYYRNVYALFDKTGMVRIRKIDMETGQLTKSYDIPLPLPEKIRIYKGDAYFLQKGAGELQKWKLVKVKL